MACSGGRTSLLRWVLQLSHGGTSRDIISALRSLPSQVRTDSLMYTQCKVNGLIGSHYELSIINFAKAITRLTRDSDVSARVGRLEFFTLLPVVTVQGLNFVDRLIQIWDSEDFEIIYSFVQYIHKESLLEFLGRLDLAESKSN